MSFNVPALLCYNMSFNAPIAPDLLSWRHLSFMSTLVRLLNWKWSLISLHLPSPNLLTPRTTFSSSSGVHIRLTLRMEAVDEMESHLLLRGRGIIRPVTETAWEQSNEQDI